LKAGVVAGGIVIFACDSICSRNMTNEIEENKLGHRMALEKTTYFCKKL